MISDRPVNAEWLKGENKERISLTDELKLFAEYIKVKERPLLSRFLKLSLMHNTCTRSSWIEPSLQLVNW